MDLDGEGLSGILTEQADGWFYKRNLSPINVVSDERLASTVEARFAPVELVATKPSRRSQRRHAAIPRPGRRRPARSRRRFEGPTPGSTSAPQTTGWEPFAPFAFAAQSRLGRPEPEFVDLTGDGHADILITRRRGLSLASLAGRRGLRPGRTSPPRHWTKKKARASSSPTARNRSISPTCPAMASPTSCASATARSATGPTSATAASAPR